MKGSVTQQIGFVFVWKESRTQAVSYSLFTSSLIHCPHPKSGSQRGRGTLRGYQMISEQAVTHARTH
ncbi:hypothetical protein B9S53_13570 [Arthrospira sp. O9.13F]|nr:hypothetical protein B9S53_13570 [Arthrospira sp. O9.13F]